MANVEDSRSAKVGALEAALERLDVADTIEELRHQVETLIARLAAEEATAGEEKREPARDAAGAPELDSQLERLGRKVEEASHLLAELADVLEAQTERIETIERQIGDTGVVAGETAVGDVPKFVLRPPRTSTATVAHSDESASIETLREYMEIRMEELEDRLARFEQRLDSLGAAVEKRASDIANLAARLARTEQGVRIADPSIHNARPITMPLLVDDASTLGPSRAMPRPAASVNEGDRQSEPCAARPSPSDALASRPITGSASAPSQRRPGIVVGGDLDHRTPESDTASGPGAHNLSTALGRPTVLVVDDAPEALNVMSIYLSKTGFQVVTATSAEDALAKLRHHRIDAIVLDARLSGASGEHVCRVLHEDSGFAQKRDIPIIVYTAYPDQYPRRVCEEWQASDYVVKGGDMLPLITALVRHTTAVSRR